jgi:hypothetical protein
MGARFPRLPLHLLRADFNQILELSDLDGIVMASSPHFQSDVQRASPWVPHPCPLGATAFCRTGSMSTRGSSICRRTCRPPVMAATISSSGALRDIAFALVVQCAQEE